MTPATVENDGKFASSNINDVGLPIAGESSTVLPQLDCLLGLFRLLQSEQMTDDRLLDASDQGLLGIKLSEEPLSNINCDGPSPLAEMYVCLFAV